MQSKTIKLKELDTISHPIVELTRGTWLVDGVEYTVEGYNGQEVMVKDVASIKFKHTSTKLSHYESEDGIELGVEDWEVQYNQLTSKGSYDEDGDIQFRELEDEFTYRKFRQKYKPKYETLYDWINVDVERTLIKIKTDNPHIESLYCTSAFDKEDSLLYVYYRMGAINKIVADCFKSLGMEFKGNIYYHQTARGKVWGNSDVSCPRWIVAFNTYIFSDNFPNAQGASNYKGTLEQCLALYESDKKLYESHIKSKYLSHFGDKEISKLSAGFVLSKLETISNSLAGVEAKQKSYSSLTNNKKELRELIAKLKEVMAGEV